MLHCVWDLPGPGVEPVSPALADGFLTTEPPGKSYYEHLDLGFPAPRLMRKYSCLVAQLVKNLPAVHETWVGTLGWEDPLEKGKATHSSILAWRIPWTEEPCGLQSVE